jgi:asparagine synthase (glutamine-hydrolysing)
MSGLLALAGWPGGTLSPRAWSCVAAQGFSVVLDAVEGPGPDVGRAVSSDGALAAFLVGSLGNRRELEDTLGTAAAGGMQRGDAAVLLRLYEGRGENALTALRGSFACALWDGRRQRLFLARDQLGLCTLFFVAERSRCVASSALGPLLALPDVGGSPDPGAIDVLLAFGTVPAPATMYTGIRQLAPGECLIWEHGRYRTQRYWQLRFPEGRNTRHVRSREAARRAREQLDDVVRQRTAGVVGGFLLSGGLGAAALLGLALAQKRPPASVASVALFDDAEVRRARGIAARGRVPHQSLRVAIDWAAAVDRAIAAAGGPLVDLEAVALAPAVAALAERDLAVVAGAGIEDIVGGGPAERAWHRCARYQTLPALVREAVDIVTASGHPSRLAWTARAARSAPIDVFEDVAQSIAGDARLALYGPELRAAVTRVPARRALVPLVGEAVAGGASDAGDTLYYLALALGAPRAGATFAALAPPAVEVRLPFLDPRVAQMAAAVPAQARAEARRRARLARVGLGDLLPAEIRRAPHATLAPPASAWRTTSLRAFAEEAFAPERTRRLGFDPDAVRRRWMESDGPDAGIVLWRLALVLRWLESPRLAAAYSSAPAATSAVTASSS